MTKDQIKLESNWFSKCLLINAYHEKQLESHGAKRPNKWRVEDTARELELSNGFISESLQLASFPHARLCPSRSDALKLMNGGKK